MKKLTMEQFQALKKALQSNPLLRTMVIVTLSAGLRISETLGLQWRDIDWLEKTVTVQRGVVKQDVDDVKTEESAGTRPLNHDVIAALTQWKQLSEFTRPEDWIFLSPGNLVTSQFLTPGSGKTSPVRVEPPESDISVRMRFATHSALGSIPSGLRWAFRKK